MGIIGEVWNGAVGVAEWLGGRRGVTVWLALAVCWWLCLGEARCVIIKALPPRQVKPVTRITSGHGEGASEGVV